MQTIKNENTRQALDFIYNRYGRMYLKKKEASKELGVSEATFDRMRKDGEIDFSLVRGSVRVPIAEIIKFL